MSEKRVLYALVPGVLAASLLIGGCDGSTPPKLTPQEQASIDKQYALDTMPEPQRHCMPDYRRQMPSAANVSTVKDSRDGGVYGCEYFMDMGIPVNTPTKLFKTTEHEFLSQNFQANGAIGGVAILGTGLLTGEINASSSTNYKRVVGLKFLDSDKAVRTLIVDDSRVKFMACTPKKDCNTVEFDVSDTKLWDHGTDQSIWQCDIPESCDADQMHTMEQVALLEPERDPSQHIYTGGPAPIGDVVSNLVFAAGGITVRVPEAELGN